MAKVKRDNPRAFETLETKINELTGYQTKVGWFESAVYPNGTPVAYIATIQEFGAPSRNIPARPFMRPTVKEQSDNWKKLMFSGSKSILKGTATAQHVMDALGAKAAGDVAKTISQIWTPPLAPRTIQARARRLSSKEITPSLTKPLVDTARMIDSVTHIVEDSR